MARAKQPTPVRRELSSEYISKADRKSPSEKEEAAAVSGAGGSVEPPSSSSLAVPMKKEAGVVTLLIDVAGIYISL